MPIRLIDPECIALSMSLPFNTYLIDNRPEKWRSIGDMCEQEPLWWIQQRQWKNVNSQDLHWHLHASKETGGRHNDGTKLHQNGGRNLLPCLRANAILFHKRNGRHIHRIRVYLLTNLWMDTRDQCSDLHLNETHKIIYTLFCVALCCCTDRTCCLARYKWKSGCEWNRNVRTLVTLHSTAKMNEKCLGTGFSSGKLANVADKKEWVPFIRTEWSFLILQTLAARSFDSLFWLTFQREISFTTKHDS